MTYFAKTEKSVRPVDGAMVTWQLIDDGPAHTSEKKVNGKPVKVIHWQPKRWVPIKVEYNNG
jgi:hypothetical protein